MIGGFSMAQIVQLSLFGDGAAAPSVPQVVTPAAPASVSGVRPAVSVEDFFFYDDYCHAAVRAGLVSDVSKGDWCYSCPVRLVCDRDICTRGMKIDVNR